MTIQELQPTEAQQRLQSEAGTQFIDVREPDEYAAVHAEGTINIPLSEFAQRYSEIDKERPTILICRSGARSMQAAQLLADNGHSDLTNLAGGTNAWVEADLPHTVGVNQ